MAELSEWAMFWSLGLAWLLGLGYITSLFYFSRPLYNWMIGISIRNSTAGDVQGGWPPFDWLLSLGHRATLGLPLEVMLLILGATLLKRLGNLLIDHHIQQWVNVHSESRLHLRAPTLSNWMKGWLIAIVVVVVVGYVLHSLQELGRITQAVTVFLGFLTFALSLASQNLLKDLIGGLLVLFEDPYAVGDVIVTGDGGEFGGLVERVGIRVTQLRNLDGELITIPNGWITVVRNLSSDW